MTVTQLFSDRSKWTTKHCARDLDGLPIDPRNDKAVCWCSSGAIFKCYPEKTGIYVRKLRAILDCHNIDYDIPTANDVLGYDVIYPLIIEAGI